MEISENERMILIKKKEEIFKITSELLTRVMNNSEKISKMNEILSLISTIESYAKPDRDLSVFPRAVLHISVWQESGMDTSFLIETFCAGVNSIKFDFTKKGLTISIPVKIKEAILNKIQFG
jgi:hypothetical protein